jgi:4-hydroxythreonine-4-phosphate dehydrogenase
MDEKDSNPAETPAIGITSGDAAGIGPEVVLKAISDPAVAGTAKFIVYSRENVIEQAKTLFGKDLQYKLVSSASETRDAGEGVFLVDPIGGPGSEIRFGEISSETSADAMRCVEKATRDAMEGTIDGFTTAPINKKGISAAGYKERGHTGFIAKLSGVDDYGMMFLGGPLKVVLLTIHVPLKDVSSMVISNAVYRKILLIDRSMEKLFDIRRPRIAVCGLNPHAGEEGVIGREDVEEILPAVQNAAKTGIRVVGPFPADTVYSKCWEGEFDVVLAMYHDQGLIPVKTLAFGRGINLTIGLPFIRTSPDHGTAYDIAGQGTADPGSMIEAIKLAVELTRNKKRTGTQG